MEFDGPFSSTHTRAGARNGIAPSQLRQRAADSSIYTGNHPGKSMPTPIEADNTTHDEGIPDAGNTTGEAMDAKNSAAGFVLSVDMVRYVVIGGVLFLLWRSANLNPVQI